MIRLKKDHRKSALGYYAKESYESWHLLTPIGAAADPKTWSDMDEDQPEARDRRGLRVMLIAPLVFVCHALEEAPRFVEWFNAHVERGITGELFWSVNLSALIITLIIAGIAWLLPSSLSLLAAITWLSFLMFANALFHLMATIVDGAYAPGVITAARFYLPYFTWVLIKIARSRQARWEPMLAAVILGAIPMLIHGYRIVFMRGRLF
jgi:hypothetical protein